MLVELSCKRFKSMAESTEGAKLLSQGKGASGGSPTLAVSASKAVAIGTRHSALLAVMGFVSGVLVQWTSWPELPDQTLTWAGHLVRQP